MQTLTGRTIVLVLFWGLSVPLAGQVGPDIKPYRSAGMLLSPSDVALRGVLGNAVAESMNGRLTSLPGWNNGELIQIFSPESRAVNQQNDWFGEHAGKWLYTAARAAVRTGSRELTDLVLSTAKELVSLQEEDGYLGTYSPGQRITNGDTVSHQASWDVWNLSYMTLGLLEVYRYFPDVMFLKAACRIGDLFLETFGSGGADITLYGTRFGMSATIMLDPVVELYRYTKDSRYLGLALLIIERMEAREGFKLISGTLANADLSTVGDGKAYQLIWNLTALTKLYRITGNETYLKAVTNAWKAIVNHHLTINGGPWGGIGKHLECFNRRGYWSPYGFVETCSVMAWIQLNRELYACCGGAGYINEIEKTAYNALLGAQYPNGMDWCYHSFDNGCRHSAHFKACCPSSGALALEELPPLVYSILEKGIACNIYAESEATVMLSDSVKVRMIQHTDYPFGGDIRIILTPDRAATFPLHVRIPGWAESVKVSVNGRTKDTGNFTAGEYFSMEETWNPGDTIDIHFPMVLKVAKKTERSVHFLNGADIYKINWFALTRGPLVFATHGLIGGTDREGAFQLPENMAEECFYPVNAPSGFSGPAYELRSETRNPLLFLPYYEAGGRDPGRWRMTWLQSQVGSGD